MFQKCLGFVLFVLFAFEAAGASERVSLQGHVPAVVSQLTPRGRLPGTTDLHLAMGLPLRNKEALDEFLRQLQDPGSTNYHKYLTPQQFTERFGPTEQQYAAVVGFAQSNGLAVVGTQSNRVILEVEGAASNVESAFQIKLQLYRHPTEPRDFFAPDREPSVPATLPVSSVEGLSDFSRPHPLSHPAKPPQGKPLSGSGWQGLLQGNDFRNAYVPGSTLTGAGQTVGLLELSDYFKVDVTNYENTIGLGHYVPLVNVVVTKTAPSTGNNAEVALDIEVAIAMAPNLSQVIVYEQNAGRFFTPSTILSRMANDNLAKQMSSSWSWTGGPSASLDSIFLQMQAQGQSFFQASGDSDAYTGGNTLDNANATVAPVDSTNLICVGGTTLSMNGSGGSYSAEQVWNYAPYGGSDANVGSSGGISGYYAIPWWQTNVSMANNNGSTSFRNIPDVALTADQVFVQYNNGGSNGLAGTSCAAPLWAGFCALVNQASVAAGGSTMGFINPALYAIANSPSYGACFHDITTGNNVGTGTAGLYQAVPGYDLCTGLGTPNGTNLINALIPAPHVISQPISQTVTNGGTAVFSVAASGQSPLGYAWLFNGANLSGGGNVSGVNSSVLTVTSVTTNNAGGYSVRVTNSLGSVTSSVAMLAVSFPPVFSAQPTNQSVVAGNTAVFQTSVSGGLPLAYQWRKNGTNVVNGANITGATGNVLTLAAVVATNAGNYTLIATNNYGSVTSSVASLTVFLPAAISTPLNPQTVQCGSNASFSVTASGTAPMKYQWSLDGATIAGATNTSLLLSNVHLPSHTVAVVVTNAYGSATNSVALAVQDTLPPVITLNGSNPFYVELGTAFADPGATANDLCAGAVAAIASGSVNTNALSTNTVTYTANDGNGNISTATRTVSVRDTTAPHIIWSFTNLTLAAGTNCTTPMPNVTGTNFILATDASGAVTITQNPATNTALGIGSNVVVLTVADHSGNTSYSTNQLVVQDQAPPQILVEPLSQTNSAGGSTTLSVTASACTSLAYQWYFTNSAQIGQTNSTLFLTNLTTGEQGDYYVIASASGGSATSAVATLTVSVPASFITSVTENADRSVTLGLSGGAGATYVLDATTNILGVWIPVATNIMGTNGASQFTDPQAAHFQQRFYRLRAGP